MLGPVVGWALLLAVAGLRAVVPAPDFAGATAEPRANETRLAARGCLDPVTATAPQWQALPGVRRKLAEALATRCRGTLDCRAGALPDGVGGLGPVLRARVGPWLCQRGPAGHLLEFEGVVKHAHGQFRVPIIDHDGNLDLAGRDQKDVDPCVAESLEHAQRHAGL